MEPLPAQEIQTRLEKIPGWTQLNGALHREYSFSNFMAAFTFLTRVALVSEKLNHHANIFNCYNRVVLDINTHDANGITERDFKWVELVDKAAS
jgi:4a-hydroxytetrahydrobiopterin dehydratase